MFFCNGCQNVQVIEPSPPARAPAPAPAPAPVASEPDAVVIVSETLEKDVVSVEDVIGSEGVVTSEHPPLPPSTPDSEAPTEDEDNDMRMPVNRVPSSFDNSNYGQKFTVHTIPSSKMTIRAYEGLPDKYVTIDTTEPVTMSLASLREVLNSIQPDPEKKRMGDTLILMIASLFVTIVLRTRD